VSPLVAAGLMLAAGGGVVFAAMGLPRGQKQALAGRIERTLGHHVPASAPLRRAPNSPWWAQWATRWLRMLFTFRLGHDWGVTIKTWKLLAIGVVAAVAALIAGHAATFPRWLSGIAAMAALLLVPRMVALRQQRLARAAFSELFPDSVDMIVRMIRAGLPVAAAVQAVGDQNMPPVSDAFRSVADQTAIGIPLEEALTAAAARVGLPDYRFFAVAVALQRSTGGNLAVTLETLADIIRKRRAMRLKANATTAEVRLSAYVLGGIPVLVTAGLSFMAPHYLEPLISDPTGNIIGGTALVSLFLAFLTMRWLVRRSMTQI
jgi:tight adherence protein B